MAKDGQRDHGTLSSFPRGRDKRDVTDAKSHFRCEDINSVGELLDTRKRTALPQVSSSGQATGWSLAIEMVGPVRHQRQVDDSVSGPSDTVRNLLGIVFFLSLGAPTG